MQPSLHERAYGGAIVRLVLSSVSRRAAHLLRPALLAACRSLAQNDPTFARALGVIWLSLENSSLEKRNAFLQKQNAVLAGKLQSVTALEVWQSADWSQMEARPQ